jgi:hypothetical protein
VLFYENTDGGHSAAANLKETAKRIALEWTYFARKLKRRSAADAVSAASDACRGRRSSGAVSRSTG